MTPLQYRRLAFGLLAFVGAACAQNDPPDAGPAPSDASVARDAGPGSDARPADTGPRDAAGDEAGLDAAVDAGPECAQRMLPAPAWPDAIHEVALIGELRWGQTHITGPRDDRRAPVPSAERSTLILFTPQVGLPSDTQLWLRVRNGDQTQGVLPMAAPGQLDVVEQRLTAAALQAPFPGAYHAIVPWSWVQPGAWLEVGYVAEVDGRPTQFRHEEPLTGLAAPHRFTVSRSKIVAFGTPDFETATQPAARILRDYFASLPAAELRWVDAEPWRLSELVVQTDSGPRRVASEAERRAVTDANHWSILKNQFALRLSLANTGRGLSLTGLSEGDSSPFSFGTSVGMGWFRDEDGVYQDIDDAPHAAGWTGWSVMWTNECRNAFIHEVGHSLTLAHFSEGAAGSWGIADEYPLDGTNLASHPWGFDTTLGAIRTWYRVDAAGPVTGARGLVGKRDPMNRGEPINAASCFPQYTGYQAQKAQQWMQNQPTITEVDGRVGIYRYNPAVGGYQPVAPPRFVQPPLAMDVAVVTLIGTIASSTAASQTYPARFSPSGNVFALPDPTDADLGAHFRGARYFLEIDRADGSTVRALIARPEVTDLTLHAYSVNLRAANRPTRVRLCLAALAYPNLDPTQRTVLHVREIGSAPAHHAPVLTAGRGGLANAAVELSSWCEARTNCLARTEGRTWKGLDDAVYFTAGDPTSCSPFDTQSVLQIPSSTKPAPRS